MTKELVLEVMNHLIGYITPVGDDAEVTERRAYNQEKVIDIAKECINDLIENSEYKDALNASAQSVGKRAYDVLEELYKLIGNKFNKDNSNTKDDQSDKTIHMRWTGISVNGVWSYRCGNIDCARLIPFGCDPNELDFCPYCGAKADEDKPKEY